MSNFVFYDFETSSSNKYWGQIIQIGAILTNENLEELEHLRRGQKQLVAINETLVADKKREKSEKSKLNSKKNPLRSKGRAKKQKIAFAQSLE